MNGDISFASKKFYFMILREYYSLEINFILVHENVLFERFWNPDNKLTSIGNLISLCLYFYMNIHRRKIFQIQSLFHFQVIEKLSNFGIILPAKILGILKCHFCECFLEIKVINDSLILQQHGHFSSAQLEIHGVAKLHLSGLILVHK